MPQAPLLNDGKTGDKIKVRIPAAQVIGHFQVLEPAILRENVALNSRRVPGAKGRLKVCTNEPSAALCSIPWSDKLRYARCAVVRWAQSSPFLTSGRKQRSSELDALVDGSISSQRPVKM